MRRFENVFTAWLLVLVFTWTSVFSASGVIVPPSKNASGDFFANSNEQVWENEPPALIPCRENRLGSTTIASGVLIMGFYSYDGLGSVRGLTDAIGTSLGQYHYDAYGLLIEDSVTVANPYLFAGERFDNDLGLYYLRARYLDVETGRFWSLDEYQGNNRDPLTLHKYLYAGGNPISNVDPSGNIPTLRSLAYGAGLSNWLGRFGMGFLIGGGIAGVDGALDGKRGWELIENTFVGGLLSGVAGATLGPLMAIKIVRRAAVLLGFMLGGGSSYTAYKVDNMKLAVFRAILGTFAFAGWRAPLPKINPAGNPKNCTNVCVATENTLAGRPSMAVPGSGASGKPNTIAFLNEVAAFFGSKPIKGASPKSLKAALEGRGPGSRAIVRIQGEHGHMLNAELVGGRLLFWDGMTQSAVSIENRSITYILINR